MSKRKQGGTVLPNPIEVIEGTFGEILGKWQSWYPFTLNDAPEDRERREHVELGLDAAKKIEKLQELSMLAYHAHVERLPETQRKLQENHEARKAWGILRKAREVALIQESVASELENIQFAAFDIPEFAIEGLLEVASNAIQVLESVAERHRGSATQSARTRESWPVLVSRSRKEFSVIQERLHALKLGEGVSKPADVKASDSTARHYAQAVYDTLTENHSLHIFIRRIYEDPDWRGTPINAPKWATDCAALPNFDRKNFAAWWVVAEAMLKDQCADLVDRPEWLNTTRHSICRTDFGKLRRGTAQSRILEKIKDALWNLAPE